MNQSTPLDLSNMSSADYERLISAATLLLDYLFETLPDNVRCDTDPNDDSAADSNEQESVSEM